MGDNTSISWSDSTWGVVRGCTRVSEGCTRCYAETMAARFSDPGQAFHTFADRDRTGSKWTGKVELVPSALDQPLRWKRPRKIFTTSMADIFHEKLTNEEIAAVFGVMAACPQHQFQVLTKRAKRMREWFEWMQAKIDEHGDPWTTIMQETTRRMPQESKAWTKYLDEHDHVEDACFEPWPLPWVWLGVSVENQDAANERISELLSTPAETRFLSCEPLIGPIDLLPWLDPTGACDCAPDASHCKGGCTKNASWRGTVTPPGSPVAVDPVIDWIIAGCESGPKARPCNVEWLRLLRDQCADANVLYFLKQAETFIDHDEAPESKARVVIGSGEGSHAKGRGPGGHPIIELPYLDGAQHAALPPRVTR